MQFAETSEKTSMKAAQSSRRPPTNTREKRTAHLKHRKDNYANKYLRDLRRSFDDADEDHLGALTSVQWANSSIRFYLREGKMANVEFEKYFLRIDANCDGRVSWEELVDFILLELTCTTGTQVVEAQMTLNRTPVLSSVVQNKHRESIFQIIQSTWTEEYITVSRESIKFWKPFPLTYKRKLNSPGPFASVCCFKFFQFLAVTTATRTLKFYHIIELDLLPISLSASPSARAIKTMDVDSAKKTIKTLQDSDIPLYNIPTQMIEATLTECQKNELKFIIGDDCGCIECYKITMPQRRTGTDYQIERFLNYNLHKRTISQISAIDEMECYASGSQDGTVKFFTILKDAIHVTRVFDDGSQVLSFTFVGGQRVIAVCTMGNDPFVWSVQPVHRTFRLGSNLNATQLITEYVSSIGERFVLTVTSKKEIKMYLASNFVLRSEFLEVEFLPPENRYTAILFDRARRILVTCSSFPIIWLEGEVEGPRRGITHQSAIVGIHYQPDFDQILTVDSAANLMIWDYNTGQRKTVRTPRVDELCCAAIDQSGRRVITATFTGDVSIWNPNSGGLISHLNAFQDSQLSVLRHFSMNGRGFLLTAGWSKVISLYRETSPSVFELINQFRGHTADITAAVLDQSGWIITGSEGGELIAWPVDMTTKPRRIELDDDTPIECMTLINHYLFVGNSDGFMSVFLLPGFEEVMSVKAHMEIVPYAISAIVSHEATLKLLTADTLGYVRLWLITTTPTFKLEPLKMIRAHDGEVTHITMIGSGKFFVTGGFDLAVRIWATDSMSLVGTLTGENVWNIKDLETWKKDSPVETDSRHFTTSSLDLTKQDRTGLKSSRSMKLTKSFVSTRSQMSLASALALTSTKSFRSLHGEEEEDVLPVVHFDFEQAKQMLEMIQNAEPAAEQSSFLTSYEPIPEVKNNEPTLQNLKTDMEAIDLLAQVKKLQERKVKTIEEYFPDLQAKEKKKIIKRNLTFA